MPIVLSILNPQTNRSHNPAAIQIRQRITTELTLNTVSMELTAGVSQLYWNFPGSARYRFVRACTPNPAPNVTKV